MAVTRNNILYNLNKITVIMTAIMRSHVLQHYFTTQAEQAPEIDSHSIDKLIYSVSCSAYP